MCNLYKPLCKELDISIEELINGEKDSSEEAKEKAIIATIKSNKKERKKLIYITITSIIIILGLIISVIFLCNKTDDMSKYYERNLKRSTEVRDIDVMLKYRNDGKYLDYYGGLYISDDSYNLIIQIFKDKIPKKETREISYYHELVNLKKSIKIEYV